VWSFPSCCPVFLSEEMPVEGLTLISDLSLVLVYGGFNSYIRSEFVFDYG
jgi:hypothetical protein